MREELWRAHEARRMMLELAREYYPWKVAAFKNKTKQMRRRMKLPKMKRDWSAEQREEWNAYLLKSRKEHEEWLIDRLKRDQEKGIDPKERKSRKWLTPEELAAREEKRRALEERRRHIREKYGFTLGKKPVTPEEIEGRKRYDRDIDAKMRERKREEIRIYNREYRRKRRAERLEREQEKWSSEQWAQFNKKQENKGCPKGSPQWIVREVVRYLARVQAMSEDAVTDRLIELGGMDFLVKGAESMGRDRCSSGSVVLAAVRALALFLDPERAVMFTKAAEPPGMRDEG